MTSHGLVDSSTREWLLRALAAATFLIFFQAYMVAPLLPALAVEFGVSTQRVGLAIPAYLIPYGISTLAYGLLADRVGARPLLLGSLLAFVVLLPATTTAHSATALIAWRVLAGVGASAVVPLALMWVGTNFPNDQRGRPLGWMFGAMAGGMAGGSTFGVMLEPVIGWRATFCAVAVAGLLVLGWLFRFRRGLGAPSVAPAAFHTALRGYRELLAWDASGRAYAFVFVNAVFHSGVFSWLGLYFKRRYDLSDVEIGAALLGYGVPGFLLGPAIGKAADRWGRARMLPLGLVVSALAAAALIATPSAVEAALVVTALSLGYDMTQPMLVGLITARSGKRPGQAMGLNVFTLFVGFGLGSVLFGEVLRRGYPTALGWFSAVELLTALAAFRLFAHERSPAAR